MTTQGLPSPVMNVLIHYVLLQSNMKLSKAYMETIASHWSRANLQTAREAMRFAKNEKAHYQQRKTRKIQPKNGFKRSCPRVVHGKKKKQRDTNPAPKQQQGISDEEWHETEQLLKKFSGKKNSQS